MSVVGVIDKYEATGSGLGVLPSRAQTGAPHRQAGGPGTNERTLTRRNNVIKVGIHVHTNRDLPMLGKPNLVNMRTMRGAQHPPMRGYYEHTHSEAMTEVG